MPYIHKQGHFESTHSSQTVHFKLIYLEQKKQN